MNYCLASFSKYPPRDFPQVLNATRTGRDYIVLVCEANFRVAEAAEGFVEWVSQGFSGDDLIRYHGSINRPEGV